MGILDRFRKKDSGPITEIYSKKDSLGIELPKSSIKSVEDKPVEIKAESLKEYPETKQFFEKAEEQAKIQKEWQDELKKRAEEKIAREKAASETFKKILEIDNKIKEIMDTPLTVEDDFKSSLVNMSEQEALKKYREARFGPSAYGEKRANEIRKQIENMADLLAKLKSDRFADNVKLAKAVKLKAEEIENSYKNSNFKALNLQDYKNYYDSSVRHMDYEVIKEINREIIGHSLGIDNDFQKILNETKSFNELLNLVHTYVTEKTELLGGLNKWGENENLQAFGEENPIARRIYEELKLSNLESSAITIFSVGDTVHLTARDFGHALSITIQGQEGKELTVEYKIPKAFGLNFVEHLRGFKTYDSEGDTARGNFFLPSSNIGSALVKFIKQVPKDTTTIEDINKFKQENALEQQKLQSQTTQKTSSAEQATIGAMTAAGATDTKPYGETIKDHIKTRIYGIPVEQQDTGVNIIKPRTLDTLKGLENVGQFFERAASEIGKAAYGRVAEAVAAKLEKQEPAIETGEVTEEYPQEEQEPEEGYEEPAEEEYQEPQEAQEGYEQPEEAQEEQYGSESEQVPPPQININIPDKIPKDLAKKLESRGIKIPKDKIKK